MPDRRMYEWHEMLVIGFLVFAAWPWSIGLIDIAWWAVTGSPLTSIPWSETRGYVLMAWPIVCALLFLAWCGV